MVLLKHIDKIVLPLQYRPAIEIVKWSYETFQDSLVMTSSFGKYSSVMLSMTTNIFPKIPVIFIDTGYFNRNTYLFIEKMTKFFNLNLKVYSAHRSIAMQEAISGRRWEDEKSEDFKNFQKELKTEPLERALRELNIRAWISGIRKDETKEREKLDVLTMYYGIDIYKYKDNGIYKIHPLFYWDEEKIKLYIQENNLPVNDNYSDICKGKGQMKECGIHCFEKGAGI